MIPMGILSSSTPTIENSFSLKIYMSSATTFALPLVSGYSYNMTVDWGDLSSSNITAWDAVSKIHSYPSSGFFVIKISGLCEAISFEGASSATRVTEIVSSIGDVGLKLLSFYGCTNLTAVASIGSLSSLTTAQNMFYQCTSLSSVPSNLFSQCPSITNFSGTFGSCTALQGIPSGLFDGNPQAITFLGTFYGCTNASFTTTPDNLFRYQTLVTDVGGGFNGVFNGCNKLVTVGTDIFRWCVSAGQMQNIFRDCTSLTTVPATIFTYNTVVESFANTFQGCTSLTTVPSGLFNTNTAVRYFSQLFQDCINLTTVPSELFRNNIQANNFDYCFLNCNKLQQRSDIFFRAGEESTRFLNRSVSFSSCFQRSSFTGIQGTAPALWNCSFGAGTPTKTNCWTGSGNSLTSLTNYNSIPSAWGGTYVESSMTFTIGIGQNFTFYLPIYNYEGGPINFVVDWGDLTTSTITSYDSPDASHFYTYAGTYQLKITGACSYWAFGNDASAAVVASLDSFSGDLGIRTLDFWGCKNLYQVCSLGTMASLVNTANLFDSCASLTSLPSDLLSGCPNATSFSYAFRGLNQLTSLPETLFTNCTKVTTFASAFTRCSALTSIPANFFRYNTLATIFTNTFEYCDGLTTLPSDLFYYNTGVTSFGGVFQYCRYLTTVPSGIFDMNTLVTSFYTVFYNCQRLPSVPSGIFNNNTLVTDFSYAFTSCWLLTSLPSNLWWYNTLAVSFISALNDCPKLQLNATIFSPVSQYATRFASKSPDFSYMNYRGTYTGAQGVAPALWSYTYLNGIVTKHSALGGPGNSISSFSNYASIPNDWLLY